MASPNAGWPESSRRALLEAPLLGCYRGSMARRFALLLVSLSGCLYPWDHADSTTSGDASGTTTPAASTGDTSTGDTSTMTGGAASGSHTGTGTDGTSTTTAPGTTADPSTTATTAPAPVCGDGDQGPGEECDDGNLAPDDGCDATCARDRLVFATSMQFSPKLIGGLSGADSLCKQLAHKADLPNWASFSAWLSDSTHHAIDRVHHGRGRYLRPDAVTVATTFDALLAGPLLAPIAADEFGAPADNGAWTGTRPDGTAVPAASHCTDWTSDDFFDRGHYGVVPEVSDRWTLESLPDTNPIFCTTQFRLYCFEGK